MRFLFGFCFCRTSDRVRLTHQRICDSSRMEKCMQLQGTLRVCAHDMTMCCAHREENMPLNTALALDDLDDIEKPEVLVAYVLLAYVLGAWPPYRLWLLDESTS